MRAVTLIAAAALAFGSMSAVHAQSVQPAPAKAADVKKGEYAIENDAKTACATDSVVWVNPKSKAYHIQGSRDYGKTKRGAYMCEKEGLKAGFHPVKGQKKS